MIKIEFLDTLYTWKVVAEQELERLEEQLEKASQPSGIANELKMKIQHQESIVGRYKTTIKTYLSIHHD